MSVSLTTPNDHLTVTEPGLYELLEVRLMLPYPRISIECPQVRDAYCSGSVVPEGSTFLVDWVPRPWAEIAPTTKVVYVPSNGTFVRPGVVSYTASFHCRMLSQGCSVKEQMITLILSSMVRISTFLLRDFICQPLFRRYPAIPNKLQRGKGNGPWSHKVDRPTYIQ